MAKKKPTSPGQMGLPFDVAPDAAVPEKAVVEPAAAPPAAEAELPADAPDEGDAPAATQLLAWDPAHWPVAADWRPLVSRFFASPTAQRLGTFVQQRLDQGAVVYPPQPLRALRLTPLHGVRVVILGQDPYHGPGQAEGLSFSVPPSQMLPPSLRNMFQEIARQRQQDPALMPPDPDARAQRGSLIRWTRQGVLLLNSCLTVEQGQPNSHANQGWEALTDSLVGAVAAMQQPVVFMLWGAYAQRRRQIIAQSDTVGQHLVLAANHPSPLSALKPPVPFIGCGHFGQANQFLKDRGEPLIHW